MVNIGSRGKLKKKKYIAEKKIENIDSREKSNQHYGNKKIIKFTSTY